MACHNKRNKCEDTNLTPLILCGVPKVHIIYNDTESLMYERLNT